MRRGSHLSIYYGASLDEFLAVSLSLENYGTLGIIFRAECSSRAGLGWGMVVLAGTWLSSSIQPGYPLV